MESQARPCAKCAVSKPLSEFTKDSRKKDGLSRWCRDCTRQYYAPRRKRCPVKNRRNTLQRKYGITLEQFQEIVTRQGGRCACCSGDFGSMGPCVDHDHDTGQIRGALCTDCNKAIGLLGDSEGGLTAAIVYLRASKSSTLFGQRGRRSRGTKQRKLEAEGKSYRRQEFQLELPLAI